MGTRYRRCFSCGVTQPVSAFYDPATCVDCALRGPPAPSPISHSLSHRVTPFLESRTGTVISPLPHYYPAPRPDFLLSSAGSGAYGRPVASSYVHPYPVYERVESAPVIRSSASVLHTPRRRIYDPVPIDPVLVPSLTNSSVLSSSVNAPRVLRVTGPTPVIRHSASSSTEFVPIHEQTGNMVVQHDIQASPVVSEGIQEAEKKEAVVKPKATFHKDILDCIGSTPMVQLNRIVDGITASKVLLKLEMQNPGGSVKDRIAKSMIEKAEEAGTITPGKTTVIEYTSGNTGIGLAMVCAAKGYRCVIVMPQLPSMRERYLTCRKFGALVHLTAASRGIKGAEEYVKGQLEQHPDYWCPRQFENEDNPQAHFDTTGPEIWEQTGGEIDYLVVPVGTGGMVSGIARYLKDKNPDIKVIALEPTESRVLVGEEPSPHTIVGIGAGFPVPLVEKLAPGQEFKEGARGIIDEFQHCNSADAVALANALATKEGLLVGPATGATVKVALDVAQRPEAEGKTVVAICTSSAIRYVSHPLWTSVRIEGDDALPIPPNMDPEPLLKWESPEE